MTMKTVTTKTYIVECDGKKYGKCEQWLGPFQTVPEARDAIDEEGWRTRPHVPKFKAYCPGCWAMLEAAKTC